MSIHNIMKNTLLFPVFVGPAIIFSAPRGVGEFNLSPGDLPSAAQHEGRVEHGDAPAFTWKEQAFSLQPHWATEKVISQPRKMWLSSEADSSLLSPAKQVKNCGATANACN